MDKLPESINFPQEEEVIIELWKKLDVFKNCLKQSKGKPRYSFYDGPPFATGLPHYGHILAGTIKDIVTRYAHQQGYHVERRFGWDTHGLPVEFEIDKALNITGPADVMKMGIANYNKECRKIVMRYASDWEKIVGRLGRWIDFENDYKTLYPWYMESIWWVFKQMFDKGLVYQGVKVMPYSTGCNTPLSNFESGQNYKDVVDPQVVVAFPLVDEPNVKVLAWTTTPWTLPSNLALCAHPDFEYVEAVDNKNGDVYILLESALSLIYKSNDKYTIKGRRKGSDLLGKAYIPLFPYFEHMKSKGAFKILNDGYVTADAGTGIVHQAPYFGEDDYRCCLKAGVITKDQDSICPVDSSGKFTEPVKDFLGIYVKDADKLIIKHIKEEGRLVFSGNCKHSYPFCWRSDTPLIYKAVPSWFIRVEAIKDKLLEANAETYWVPEYVKDKRFGNWLRDARDWAISRNRYWGNPIPLWISEDKKEVVCIGSIAELEKLTGKKVTDIHRESIDDLEIPSSRPGQPPLRRVPEVFDCWFESGSMPYAQVHYPFERATEFEKNFPADFIAEGIDQTRGWFYTLLVISTALFGKAPFKNLIANGLVLASDGQKMSKRKKNYPDPMEVVNKYGADALRLYLINSPVVRAENLRFKEEGVRDVVKDVLLPWYNAFRFLLQNVERFERSQNRQFTYKPDKLIQMGVESNIMDRWIISFTESLQRFVEQEMKAYRLYTVVPRLLSYIDNLTNWYVRMNRARLKADGQDGEAALSTLTHVLLNMARLNASFTPFLAEFMFQRLRPILDSKCEEMRADSVHYLQMPEAHPELFDDRIEQAVSALQTVVDLGRQMRERRGLPLKYPLPELIVIYEDETFLEHLRSLEQYLLGELNVRSLSLSRDKSAYGVGLRAEPDFRKLGSRLKNDFKTVDGLIRKLSSEQLEQMLQSEKPLTLHGHDIALSDIRLLFNFDGPRAEELRTRYETECQGKLLVMLDCSQSNELVSEGLAREFINRVQRLRKKVKLVPSDEATVYFKIEGPKGKGSLFEAIQEHREFIVSTTGTPQEPLDHMPTNIKPLAEETFQLKESTLHLALVTHRESQQQKSSGTKKKQQTEHKEETSQAQGSEPYLDYVNLELTDGLQPRFGATERSGSLWLRQHKGKLINFSELRSEIDRIFGIHGCHYNLFVNNCQLDENSDLSTLRGSNVYIVKSGKQPPTVKPPVGRPTCRFINIIGSEGKASILLENPKGNFALNSDSLRARLNGIFPNANILLPPISPLAFDGFSLRVIEKDKDHHH